MPSRSTEPLSARYLLSLTPTEKARLHALADERGLTVAALIRLGLERETAAYARAKRDLAA